MPPQIDAVNVTATPAGDGAVRDAEMPFKSAYRLTGAPGGGGGTALDVPPDVMGNAMLPFDAALSYASAELPALRTQTATRFALFATSASTSRCCWLTNRGARPSWRRRRVHHLS